MQKPYLDIMELSLNFYITNKSDWEHILLNTRPEMFYKFKHAPHKFIDPVLHEVGAQLIRGDK